MHSLSTPLLTTLRPSRLASSFSPLALHLLQGGGEEGVGARKGGVGASAGEWGGAWGSPLWMLKGWGGGRRSGGCWSGGTTCSPHTHTPFHPLSSSSLSLPPSLPLTHTGRVQIWRQLERRDEMLLELCHAASESAPASRSAGGPGAGAGPGGAGVRQERLRRIVKEYPSLMGQLDRLIRSWRHSEGSLARTAAPSFSPLLSQHFFLNTSFSPSFSPL